MAFSVQDQKYVEKCFNLGERKHDLIWTPSNLIQSPMKHIKNFKLFQLLPDQALTIKWSHTLIEKKIFHREKKGKTLRLNCWYQIGWIMDSTSEILKSTFLFCLLDCS